MGILRNKQTNRFSDEMKTSIKIEIQNTWQRREKYLAKIKINEKL